MNSSDYDFWMANGSPNFGILPMGVPDVTDKPAPIRLQRGNEANFGGFGAIHIEHKHGHWVRQHAKSVPELVWVKCRQVGTIYIGHELQKGKIWLPLHPSAFMVLRFFSGNEDFWSVTTIYLRPSGADGESIGRYEDTMQDLPQAPTFTIRPLPRPPVIHVKPRRKTLGPRD